MASDRSVQAEPFIEGPADPLTRNSLDLFPEQQTYPHRPSVDSEKEGDSDEKPASNRIEGDGGDSISRPDEQITQNEIAKVESRGSIASKRSKISHAISSISRTKSKKEHLPAVVLPLSDLEQGVIGWESQNDPKMPLNFTEKRKYLIVMLLSFVTLMTPLSSSIIAPAISIFSKEFNNTDETLAAMPVSIFLLGFAVGPLFLAPLSEIYGRSIILTCSNAFFCCWQIACALAPTLSSLIVFRFLAGIGGIGCMTLGGGIIADVFPVEQRGFAISIWTIGPTVGPSLAPLIGAFIASTIGWRMSMWIVFAPTTLSTIIMAFALPETNHRVLIQRKVDKLRKELDRPELRSCYETAESRSLSKATVIKQGLLRPLKMLFLSPMISVLSIYISFVYGTIYLMYNTVPTVFQGVYGWSTGVSGLAFISLGLGYASGLFMFSFLSDRAVIRLTKANGGKYEPEMRLPTMIYFATITPITFFWYGWAADKHAPWAVSVIGLFPLGVGLLGIWMPAQAYIIDAYPQYAASGLAAFTVLRSIVAAFLPLAGPTMFARLGLGWGNSVLGFICIAMIPVPLVIHRYGGQVRRKYPLKL